MENIANSLKNLVRKKNVFQNVEMMRQRQEQGCLS